MDLAGRRALVTGGSKGLGAEVARQLAAAGADVAILYRQDEEAAAQVGREVEEAGRRALLLRCHLAQARSVAATFRRLRSAWGGLDLLVNNAAVAPVQSWDVITPKEWSAVLAVNLTGPFLVLREALPLLAESPAGGAAVNVGSVVSRNGGSFGPAYAASKAGLEGLTRSAAREWGPRGVRVNCVAPGPLDSPLARALPAPALEAMAAQTPLRRLGTFSEAAAAILWLLSPAASYINGQTVVVDGGRVMI